MSAVGRAAKSSGTYFLRRAKKKDTALKEGALERATGLRETLHSLRPVGIRRILPTDGVNNEETTP